MPTDPPQPEHDAASAGRPGAIRLTLAFDASGVTVIDRTPVGLPVPPHAAEPRDVPSLPAHAVVAELRAADDTTTYRQVVEHAIPADQEVFDPSYERGVQRLSVPPPSGVFTVIVPDDAAAAAVVLLAGPRSTGAARALAAGLAPPAGPVELTRFPLRAGGGDGIG